MARPAKASTLPEPKSRKRLTPDQKAEIAASLARGESGGAIAARLGVSVATIYAQRRKGAAVAIESATPAESPLRKRLVTYAVRSLLGQEISEDERSALEHEVRDELVKRVAAGI